MYRPMGKRNRINLAPCFSETRDNTGDDARHRIPELEHLLAQYNFKKLVAFFLKRP